MKKTEAMHTNNPGWNRATAIVTGCDKLNVRSQASADSKVLTVISSGDTVTIVDRGYGDWTAVRIGNINGYVMSKYITITGVDPNGQYTGDS